MKAMDSQSLQLSFTDFLRTRLSSIDFDNLSELVGLTKSRTTRLLNRPGSASMEEIIRFYRLLKITPYSLYEDHGLGKGSFSPFQVEFLKEHHERAA